MPKVKNTNEMSCVAFSNFLELYLDIKKTESWEKVSALIDERAYTVKNVGVSNRVMSHWDSQGVSGPSGRPDEKAWRKFNFQELVWLKIVQELRAFGMSLEQLKNARKTMFTFEGKELLWPFKFAVFLSLHPSEIPVTILAFQNGQMLMGTPEQMALVEDMENACIKINLNNICRQLLKRNAFNAPSKIRAYLTEAQYEVLGYMEDKNYREILINLEKDNEYQLKLTDINASDITVAELLQSMNYGQVTIKKANNEIIWTRREKHKRIKKC